MAAENRHKLTRWLYSSAFLWIFVFVSLWQYLAAPMYDDISYLRMVTDDNPEFFWDGGGPLISGWEDALISSINHYKVINGRLTNILMILTVPLPHWLSSCIAGILVAMMMFLVFMAAHLDMKTKNGVAIVWITSMIMWKWMPWADSLISRDYLLNYVTPSVTAIIYGIVFLTNRKPCRSLYFIGISAALLTGLLHEGYSLPLIGSSCILLFSSHNRRLRMILLTFLVIGAMICILSPSTIYRAKNYSGVNQFKEFIPTFISGIKSIAIPLTIVCLTTIWALLTKKRMIILLNPSLLFWILTALGGILIAFVMKGNGRFLWLATVCFIIYTITLVKELWHPSTKTSVFITLFALAICIGWSVAVLNIEKKVSENQYGLINNIKANEGRPVFYNLKRFQDIPFWTFGMVHQYLPTQFLWSINFDYAPDRIPLILPEKYKGKRFKEWEKLPGDNPYRGFDGFWYSHNKIERGTLFLATMGKATPQKNPIFPSSTKVYVMAGYPYYAIDENNDTLWISNLNIPLNREILRLDVIN